MSGARYGDGGGGAGRRLTDDDLVEKRYRSYDAEHRRQRNIGMAESALGIGGATAAGVGARRAHADTKKLRDLPVRSIQGKTTSTVGGLKGKGVLHVTGRNAALLGAGGAALGGVSALRRWAESNRGRAFN